MSKKRTWTEEAIKEIVKVQAVGPAGEFVERHEERSGAHSTFNGAILILFVVAVTIGFTLVWQNVHQLEYQSLSTPFFP